jgi:beta-glucosidase
MHLRFPDDFFWGTSTAAAQIETASNHNWRGLKAKDGEIFNRTTDHELRRNEDAKHIMQFGSVYRCGVDWARLQTEPYGHFHHEVVEEYRHFFQTLRDGEMHIMFVLHHFTHPTWFEQKGGWLQEDNIAYFQDYVTKCIKHFGKYVSYWNTFNEPNVYALNGYIMGAFPPYRKNYFKANTVLKNMSLAHKTAYSILKSHDFHKPIGISLNTAVFEGKNILGKLPAAFTSWWFIRRAANLFKICDFWGLSYYAHILFDPFPISEVHAPGKLDRLGIPHDMMWAYKPQGLAPILKYFHNKYKKPIIITENGICTDDPELRIKAIKEYLKVINSAINHDNIHILGYIHWSTWDNFEWDLGLKYKFGLMSVDPETKDRTMTSAAHFYAAICKNNEVEI